MMRLPANDCEIRLLSFAPYYVSIEAASIGVFKYKVCALNSDKTYWSTRVGIHAHDVMVFLNQNADVLSPRISIERIKDEIYNALMTGKLSSRRYAQVSREES